MIRGPLLAGSRLLAVAGARPTLSVDAAELGAPYGKDAAWVNARTGIDTVRRVGPDDDIAELAIRAGREAVRAAGVDVDFVVTATCSAPPGPRRNDAVAAALAPGIPHVELNVACSGFCYALASADAMIRTGQAEHVVVVAAEQMSRYLDPADLGTSIIFGDGAGAAVLGPADEPGVGPVVWGSDGSQAQLIACDSDGENYLRMQGQSVFRWAVELVPRIAAEACRRAGVALSDIEVFVPHQANLRIIDAVARRLGLEHAQIADDVTSTGNTSAASVPLALEALTAAGRARSGALALLVGFGAGLAYAAQVVRLP